MKVLLRRGVNQPVMSLDVTGGADINIQEQWEHFQTPTVVSAMVRRLHHLKVVVLDECDIERTILVAK